MFCPALWRADGSKRPSIRMSKYLLFLLAVSAFGQGQVGGVQQPAGAAQSAQALNVPFQCHLAYSQATAAVADSFGIQATVAPTNIFATGQVFTNTTAFTAGNLPTLSSTTATNIVTGTPSAITTVWNAELSGFVENPSTTANTINIMVKTATAADAVTVKRGSFCVVQ